MTNYARFREYMRGNHGPRLFADAVWIYVISAALERRVWLASGMTIYPNHYILLCGPPGVGKGISINEGTNLLNDLVAPGHSLEQPLYILKRGPDSCTYEKLASILAKNTVGCSYVDKTGKTKRYAHASLRMELDEFTSMFHKNASDLVTLLLSLWSGYGAYDRSTNKHGQVLLINPIVSFIAGTTPKNIHALKDIKIIDTGLDRRILMVFAGSNEFRQALIPEKTPEQMAHRAALVEHLKKLAGLCGPVYLAEDALAFYLDWWKVNKDVRVNFSPKLNDYEENKNSNILKLAIVLHLSEGDPVIQHQTPISIFTVKQAIEWTQRFEVQRHLVYTYAGDNELHRVAIEIQTWLRRNGPSNFGDIWSVWFNMVKEAELKEILNYLQMTGRCSLNGMTMVYSCRDDYSEETPELKAL